MADPSIYTYPSPLKFFDTPEGLLRQKALTDERDEDGKSLKNVQTGVLSGSYEQFEEIIDRGRRGGFDVHIYHFQSNPTQSKFAEDLHSRIRLEFPELRIYTFHRVPIGPHPVAMFEVNLFSPAQFGAFIPWLMINRGPLSVLVHPNSVGEGADEYRDHTQRAMWMGERITLDLEKLRAGIARRKEQEERSQDD